MLQFEEERFRAVGCSGAHFFTKAHYAVVVEVRKEFPTLSL